MNPRSVGHVITDEYGVFDQGFWVHCRPLLCIDDTHLYGKYKGTLLVATAVDANDHLCPLAYVIVKSESFDSWDLFFACMHWFIYSVNNRRINASSDRMKGILNTLETKWHLPYKHRFCVRHLKANFQAARFREKRLIGLFYAAACASEEAEYNKIQEEIKTISSRAHNWIERSLGRKEENWALCKHDGGQFHVMTTNTSESFNGVLKGARSLPAKALIAYIFFRLVDYFCQRRDAAEKITTYLTPKWEAKITDRANEARHIRIVHFSQVEWQVVQYFGDEFKVIINVSNGADRADNDFALSWYTVEKYFAAYTPKFNSIYDKDYWTLSDNQLVLPPIAKRELGHPCFTRIKGTMDEMQASKGKNVANAVF